MASGRVPREPGINAFRIFNLALIIFAHAKPLAPPMQHDDPRYLLLIIAQCSVPMFFITSGYLLRWREGDPFAVTRWSFRKLLPLYAIWAFVFIFGAWLIGAGSLPELLATLPGGPTQHLWFLPALALALSVMSLSLRFLGLRLSWIAAIILAVGGLWFGSYEQWIGLPAHSLRSGIPTAPLFVLIGVYLAESKPPRRVFLFAGAVILAYGLQVWDDKLLSTAPGFEPGRQAIVTLATLPYAIAMFLFARSLHGRVVERLAALRPYFATIYCIHPMFIVAFAMVIHERSFGIAIAVTLMTLVLSVLAGMALEAMGRFWRERLHSHPPLRAAAHQR